MGAVQQGTINMNGSPSFLLNWNLFGNNNGSPLFQQFDWSNLSLPSLTSNGSPLNNNLPYYPFGGNYYINPIFRRTTNGSPASASGVDDGTSSISAGTAGLDKTDTIFDTDNNNNTDTFGLAFGNIFSSGLSSAGNKILNNIVKGETFSKGVIQDASSTISGAAAGLASNMVGKGITSLMGNSKLGRGVGQGVATGIGTIGGQAISNLLKGEKAFKGISDSIKAIKTAKQAGSAASDVMKLANAGKWNLVGIGGQVLGSGLLAAFGPSKEYAGKYGNITQTMDTIYDSASAIAGTMGPIGMGVSGLMTLNKGLSNVFGSTDGMCVCAGTKVFTSSGDIINIEDLILEKGIIGWDENSHSILPNNIAGIIEPRLKECLEIELKNGTILRCSIDHPILSNIKEKAESHRINGKRIAYREWSFRRADELKVGNFVGLANNIDYWGKEKLPNAYLIGMLIGDGTYTYESSCRLCSVDPSTWKYIEDNNLGVINNCSGNDPNKYSTEYRTYRIINGMELMKDLGIAYLSGTNKTLPKNLGKYDKDSICKMIAGLYDTDGSISVNEEKELWKITFYLSNLDLLEHLKLLLLKLGIFSTIYTRKASINKLANGKIINSNKSYRLEITDMYSANNFYNNIPLNIDYKKEHLERIHLMLLNKKPLEHNELSGAKQYKIISIKSIGIQTVYNLEASETHTYLANGIITHNTKTDAILGSAFMPAPVKWLNMWGSSKTGTFNNQSWQNSEQANSFMLNGFGNLNEKFQRAMEEAGKRYGTFSQGAKNRALRNIDFANTAWEQVLLMAAQNRLLNIRSLDMTSINNLKYTQWIQGGWNPSLVGRGKLGMKIFNNATNHNIGMRLLSAAALIDNKQMILSAQGGTKVTRPPRMRAHKKGDESKGLTPEEQEWWRLHEEDQKKLLEEETARKIESREKAAARFNKQVNTVMGAMTLQANETPFTGQEYQQAAKNLRQEKVEEFHEKAGELEKGFNAALMADLAVSAAPLLLRGFRWAFNKAGLLVKVPKMAYSAEVKSPYYKIGQDGNLTFDTENVVSKIKSGKQDFINEILSPEYAEAAIRNMEEAEKMGLSYTPVFEKPAFKSLREDGIIPKFVQDPKHTWHARTSFFGGTPGKATEIEYNLSQSPNIRQATGHESGHVSKWGMGETKEEHEFMKYKASLIFKDEGDVGVYEFGSLTGEAATNMRDLGKQMGITQRTPYPGYEEALKRLKEAEVTSNKGGIVKVLKLTKEAMPHIWRALQGLHFEYAIPTALTATTLYNTNK